MTERRMPAILAVLSMLLAACGTLPTSSPVGTSADIPSSEAARAALAALVQAAQAGDFAALCRNVDGEPDRMCERNMEGAGPVPRADPVVIAERTFVQSATSPASRILTYCGLRDDGTTYRSESEFLFQDGRLEVVQRVWWADIQMGDPGPIASASTGGEPGGAACP